MLFDLILRHLVRFGSLTVRYPNGLVRQYGGGGAPEAAFALTTRRAVRRMVSDPSLAIGELYMAGELVPIGCDAYAVIALFLLNLHRGNVHPLELTRRSLRTLRRRIDQLNSAAARAATWRTTTT